MYPRHTPFGTPGLRLLQLYILLGTHHRAYSLGQLAKVFRCSRQTILRMTEQLGLVPGVPLDAWIEDKERYYRIKEGRKNNPISLSIESLRYLVLCRDIVSHLLPKPFQEKIRNAIGETSALLGGTGNQLHVPDSFAEARGKGTIDYTPHQAALETIQQAMRERRCIEIRYAAKINDPVKTFTMAPMRLLAFRESLYVRGYLLDNRGRISHKKPATLAIQRIRKVEILDRYFARLPENHDLDFFGFEFNRPLRVRIKFSPEVATYVSERTWSADQQIQQRKDGSIVICMTTTSRPELLSWVMSFGKEAELLAPAALRRELRAMLAATIRRYK
jgi:predicted DNA-binding transcriptional regulator YafY